MSKFGITVIVFALLIGACAAPIQNPPTATATAVPSPTLAQTPTIPAGMINVGEKFIPDLRISNPELLDTSVSISPIVQFVKAMNTAGIEITAQQVLDALENPANYEARTDTNGNLYVQFAYTITAADFSYSTGFLYDEQGGWRPFTLRDLGAKRSLRFGTSGSGWLNEDTTEFMLAIQQVDFIVPWPVWLQLQPEPDTFDFSALDQESDRWHAEDKTLHNVPLVIASGDWSLPDWLKEGSFSKDELARILQEYITMVVTHGKELGITQWIVVTEPYLPVDRENDLFYKTFGGYDYIDLAFEAARKADPQATLIYNDIDNYDSGGVTSSLTHEIVARLRSKGLVDAVGIQAHLGDWAGVPDFEDMTITLQGYGLPVVVTEFDYNLVGVSSPKNQREAQKASVFHDFLSAALEAGVTDITFSGLDERTSGLEKAGQREADPTMFNMWVEPQPAYYAVLNALAQPALISTSAQTVIMMDIDGLSIPDPRLSNPELFDSGDVRSPIYAFIESMKTLNISVDSESVTQNLLFERRTGKEGNTFCQVSYYFDPDPEMNGEALEGKIPLLIAAQNAAGEWIWGNATSGDLTRLTGRKIGALIWSGPNDKEFLAFSSIILVDIDWNEVIRKSLTVEEIISKLREAESNHSKLDPESVFDFAPMDAMVELANRNGKEVLSGPFYVPWTVPDSVYQNLSVGKLSFDDFDLFLQFYTESLVKRYDGATVKMGGENDKFLMVERWIVLNEIAAHIAWTDKAPLLRKLIENGTFTRMFVTAKAANKNAKFHINEDGLLEQNTADVRSTFIWVIEQLQKQQAPIDGIQSQNHLWLGSPLLPDNEIDAFFQLMDQKNLSANISEMTISQSQKDVFTGETARMPFDDADFRQTVMLASILRPMKSRTDSNIIFFAPVDYPGPFTTHTSEPEDPTAKAGFFRDFFSTIPHPMYYVLLEFLSQE